MVRRYAHLAPNHLSEHARQIDVIFDDNDTITTQGGNQAGLKLAQHIDFKWYALQGSNL